MKTLIRISVATLIIGAFVGCATEEPVTTSTTTTETTTTHAPLAPAATTETHTIRTY